MKIQHLIIGGLFLAALGLAVALALVPRIRQSDALSGYVEGEPLYPAAPLSGRLVAVSVKRGDVVRAGDPLFTVDLAQGEAGLNQALAELASAKALAADARKGQRPVELDVIRAQLAAAQAQLTEAEKALARTRPLVEAGAAPRAQLDAAMSARDTAAGEATALRKQLQAAQLGARQEQIAAADERVRQAQAAVDAARSRLGDQAQSAPASGRIEEVYYQIGEWVPANQPLLSLIPDGRVRVRFFVPETQVANYTTGREVSFTCDACPPNLKAQINYVSPRPEFTPPVIYSRDARDRMVFLVEALPIGETRLVPGQPVDVAPIGAADAPIARDRMAGGAEKASLSGSKP